MISINLINHIRWEDVPQDLIILLIEKLTDIISFIRVGATCDYWHSIFMANPNFSNKQLPWLMLADTETSDDDAHREFYDISTDEIYQLHLPQVKGRKIAGSAHGWLVTAGLDSQFHLCNPLTGTQIRLPPQSTFEVGPMLYTVDLPNGESRREEFQFPPQFIRKSFMLKATLSPNPKADDYTVIAVHFGFGTFCLSYCRSGDDAWTQIVEGQGEISYFQDGQREIACLNEQFYSITINGVIYSCEVNPKPKMEKIFGFYSNDVPEDLRYYIVECNGELLVVMRLLNSDADCHGNKPVRTGRFIVYRLDMETKMASEIKNIGDHALFLGHNNSMCVPTAATKLRRNCIYFVEDGYDLNLYHRVKDRGDDMGVFSLDDESITPHYKGKSVSTYSPPIWFTPDLSL